MILGLLQTHPEVNVWHLVGGFNLLMALVMGSLWAVSFRAFTLIVAERNRPQRTVVMRVLLGVVFLALSVLYTTCVWPMMIWDHAARILAVGTPLLAAILTVARRRKNPDGPYPPSRPALRYALVAVLLFLAAATTLRAGLVTLKGHRVVQLVEVTGETRLETVPGDRQDSKQVTAHHVILLLTDGSVGADVWVYGSRMAFGGRAFIVSKTFNSFGMPNLYEFLTIHNGEVGSGKSGSPPAYSVPFPDGGTLAVPGWWRPVRNGLLNAWAWLGKHSRLLGLQIIANQSPYYPLTDAQGRPLKRNFLLDLTLEGIPTSRGSSPLERL